MKIKVIFRSSRTDDIGRFYKGIARSPFLLASTRSELNLMTTRSKNGAYFKDWGCMLLLVVMMMAILWGGIYSTCMSEASRRDQEKNPPAKFMGVVSHCFRYHLGWIV